MANVNWNELKSDFGISNLALIVVVAGILGFLAIGQRPVAALNSASKTALVLPEDNLSGTPQTTTVLADNGATARVLGASTYDKDFVNGLNVDVKTTADSNDAARLFASQMQILASGDKLADGSQQHETKFLNDVKQLAVPQSLVDYQKLFIAYYQLDLLIKTGKGDANTPQLAQAIQAQLQLARTTMDQAFQINLP